MSVSHDIYQRQQVRLAGGSKANRKVTPPTHSAVVSRSILSKMLLIGEAAIIFLAAIMAKLLYINGFLHSSQATFGYAGIGIIGAVTAMIAFLRAGLYEPERLLRHSIEARKLLFNLCLTMLVLLSMLYLLKVPEQYSLGWMMTWFVLAYLGLLSERMILRRFSRALDAKGGFVQRFAIFGTGRIGKSVRDYLERNPNIRIDGAFDDSRDAVYPGEGGGERSDIMVIGARGIPDAEGGAEKHAERLFPIFADRGYFVTLLGISRFIRARSYRGIDLRRIPTLALAGTDKLVYHFLAFLYAAIARPQIVHLQGLNSAFFLLLYKLCGLKVVMRYGSADHEHAKWGIVGRLGFRLCELQIRYADHVIAVSQKYKETLQRRYGLERISVIPNGLDRNDVNAESLAYWQGLGMEGVRYVLAVGRVTVDKDYDTLVKAVTSLADKKVVLVVAGGPDEKGYADRFFDHPDKRVRFLGCVDRSLLPALYTNCAVYVNCSRYEGLSNAILEAISFNRPVIASDIPANTEMGLRECSYFRTGDATILHERIEQALADPEALIADKKRFHSWEEVYLKTENVYHEVLPDLLARRPVVTGSHG